MQTIASSITTQPWNQLELAEQSEDVCSDCGRGTRPMSPTSTHSPRSVAPECSNHSPETLQSHSIYRLNANLWISECTEVWKLFYTMRTGSNRNPVGGSPAMQLHAALLYPWGCDDFSIWNENEKKYDCFNHSSLFFVLLSVKIF